MKLLGIAAILLLSSWNLQAQNEGLAVSVASASGSYGNGEDICVDLIVDDFTDFYFVSFSIAWNPDVLEFVGVTSLDEENELNLEDSDYILTRTDEGLFTFSWEDESGEGATISTRNIGDNYGIFRLCFRTSDDCGGETKIDIVESSETIFRSNTGSNPRNIGFTDDEVFDADISVQGTPVTIVATQEVANPDEIVCVSINAEKFKGVEGAQYSLVWDTSVIRFNSIENINPSFPFLSSIAINTRDALSDGVVIFSWFSNSGSGVDVDDNTPMFDICFLVVGEGGSSSLVEFSSEPRVIEIATSEEGNEACKLLENGQVLVREQKGEVTIKSESGTVKPGDAICVDFVVDDFFAVNELNFSVNWDPNILRFDSISDMSLRGLSAGDFFTGNTNTGFLTLTWDDETGILLPDGSRIFSLCFTAVGPVGSSTQVSFVDEPQPIFVSTTSTNDAGLNTRSGTVNILPPESLNLNVSNATVSPSEEFCVDVLAENFTDVVNLVYSMGWETTLIEFVSVTNFGIEGLSEANFDLSNAAAGFLSLDWSSMNPSGESIPNDEVLYSICFRAKQNAQLGLCNAIFFSDIPAPIRAVTANSGGNSIEVTDQGNDICIFDPGGLTVSIEETVRVAPDSIICVPFTVRNFNELSTMNFSMNWNPSIFQFASININGNLTGLAQEDFMTNLSNLGVLGVSWTSSDGSGVTINNGDVIFEVCLKAVGSRLACSPIEITSSPVGFEVKSPATGDENLSLNPLNSQICIADALELEILSVEEPSCSDSEDGSASIVINGGDENYQYVWRNSAGETVAAGATASTVDNLGGGTYFYTITDGTGLMLSDSIVIEPLNAAPIANAGADRTLTCGETSTILLGLGSSNGRNIVYDWNVIEGTGSQVGQTMIINSPGRYELVVQNDSTGCSARDTIVVTSSELPNVDAGGDQQLSCAQESIELDGSNSDQADNITYQWIAQNGGEIEGDDTALTINTSTAGTYILILSHSEGCSARDTVEVTDGRTNVRADAGNNQILNCSGEPVTLGGSNSSMGDDFTAQWESLDGGVITGENNTFVVDAVSPGTYVLTVTNQVTGCFGVDTVSVLPDEQLPTITPGFIDQLDCITTEVALNILVGNTNGDSISVQWRRQDGDFPSDMENERTPTVSEPGVYSVVVTNTESGCFATSENIVVTANFDEPTANISGDNILGCGATASLFLSTQGSSVDTQFVYTWTASNEDNIIRSFLDSAEVFEPDTYYLEVTNITNGCSAIDSITVTATEDRPVVAIEQPIPIPCTGGTSEINGSNSSEGTFSWIVLEGDAVILNSDTSVVTVTEPGLFGLRITNDLGCTAFDSVRVTQADTASIQISVEYSSTDLTCTVNSSNIVINTFPEGNYTFNWLPESGQNVPNPMAASNEISDPGLIRVEVTETDLNCTKTAFVILNQDAELSEVVVSDDPAALTLDCSDSSVTLDASGTNPSNEETFVWKGPDGNIIPEATSLTPEVTQAGTYTFVLSNAENGCSDSLSVVVENASDLVAVIDSSGILTCENTQLLLRAFNSSAGQNISYEWTSAEGNSINPVEPGNSALITEPGTYTLLVRDEASNCETTTSITIEEDREEPIADAGQDVDLGCGGVLNIGGNGSSTGTMFDYTWTLDGQAIADQNAQIDVSTPGTYILVVTNTDNGCEAKDEILVTQNFELEQADAGSDEVTCESDSLMLLANLPANAMGTWRTASGAVIADNNDPETLIGRLESGDNLFVWTLSTAECPNYSSDTVNISVERSPVANNDQVMLDLDKQDSVAIKLIANDNLFNIVSWNTDISTKPEVGSIISLNNGVATYSARSLKSTMDQFTYTLCSASCPTLCDSATVSINILVSEEGLLDNQPNVITPNGDGKNETLIFDILEGGSYPDNEMIIFNRWGDKVYESKPYQNDWDGKGNDGSELPQATYFYILRLDIAEGLILRGDVTVIK